LMAIDATFSGFIFGSFRFDTTDLGGAALSGTELTFAVWMLSLGGNESIDEEVCECLG